MLEESTTVVILSITTDAVPEVPEQQKLRLKRFEQAFWAVTAHYGFMESPDVADILRRCRARGLEADVGEGVAPDVEPILGRMPV